MRRIAIDAADPALPRDPGGRIVVLRGRPDGQRVVRHSASLRIVLEGAELFEIDGRRYRLEAGRMMLVPAGSDMIVTATHPLRSFSFELPEDAPEPAFSRTLLLPLVAHPVGEWLTVAATLLNSPDNALDAAREALANLRERVGCLVDDCRAQMAGMETAKESTQIDLMARIAAARAYLLTHAGRTVDLTELARVACMSPFHLNRRFRQAFGVSPAAYHRAARMALAKERLAGGMAPGAVGAGLGFASPASFSRAFAQYYGVPPGRHE